jgi:hypothetical protein
MNKIELTNKQKSKLLKMIKESFSEYTDVTVRIINEEEAKRFTENPSIDANNCVLLPYKDMSNIDAFINHYKIHWFEFCMTHLAKKVIPNFNNEETINDNVNDFDLEYRQVCFGFLYKNINEHPIDYLYDLFNKQKIKKT